MADRSGQQIDEYRLIRLLGEGGFGEVYLGEHLYQGGFAAIKLLRVQLTPQAFKDFLREARTFKLKHPHIVPVLDFGIDAEVPFRWSPC